MLFSFLRKSKKLILHVGRHKTGTSTLQHHLTNNSSELLKHGIIYPKIGRKNVAHHDIPNRILNKHTSPNDRAEFKKAFLKETDGYETVIISSEAFQSINDVSLVRDLFEGFEIFTIGYAREVVEYAASSYAQLVKIQPVFIDFQHYSNTFNIDLNLFFSFWSRASNHTNFGLFDRDTLFEGDIVKDFCRRAEIPPLKPSVSDMNLSISGNLLYFKLLVNFLQLNNRKQHQELTRLSQKYPKFSGKFQISPDIQTKLRQRPYNDILESSIQGKPKMRNFSDFPPIPNFETWEADYEIISQTEPFQKISHHIHDFARSLLPSTKLS